MQPAWIPEGDFDHTVFYGRPADGIRIYERTRNIRLFKDGSGWFATPTPSGQKVLIQPFNVKGKYVDANTQTRYVDMLTDEYGTVAGVNCSIGNSLRIYTRGSERCAVVGCMGVQRDNNFQPMESLVEMAKASRPGNVDMDAVNRLLGCWVYPLSLQVRRRQPYRK